MTTTITVTAPASTVETTSTGYQDWWCPCGVNPSNVAAAYASKGAASYAASKVNLVDSGTYTLLDGTAYPSWSAETGWSFVRASSQYLYTGSAWFTTVPLTMICRFKSDSVAVTQYLMQVFYDADNSYSIVAAGATAGDPVQAQVVSVVRTSTVPTSTGYTAGNSYVATGVFITGTRYAYIDGGSMGSATIACAGSGFNISYIGKHGNTSAYMSGIITSCAIYNIALTEAQIQSIGSAMP